MTQITLQAYLKEIEQLIDDNRLTEAVAHCKHILRQHPHYIEAYRLLGKTLLEQHEYVSATDIFQRILSADPEDFVAHVGLSVAYKAEELMNDAIWHMERAYEIQPYHTTIQHELRDLYAWRDGELKTRELQIPPIALARLHFNAGLYQQAINTLRATLNEQPDRVDARTLLAEALWRDDQRVDAVDVCLQLLETLPYCIKANAILSEIWLMTGRIDEAQGYLQKLQALTLPTRATLTADTPVTSAFNTDGAIPIPQQIMLEKLDKVVEEEMVLSSVPNWVDDLDLGETFLEELAPGDTKDAPLTVLPTTEHTPDWLRALTEPAPAEPSNRESADVLDWLREVATSGTDDTLTIVSDLPVSPALVDTSPLPDWLSEVLEDDALIPPVEPHLVTPPPTPAATSQEDDEKWIYDDAVDAPPGIPEWMDSPEGDVELHPAPPHESLKLDEFPDWLDDKSTTTATDWSQRPPSAIGDDWFNAEPASPPDDQELSGWLDSLASPSTPAEPASSSGELPDWFSDLTSQTTPAPSESEKTDLPDWLADLSASPEPAPRAKSSGKGALPDWLSDLTSSPIPDSSPPEPPAPPADEVVLPDWLNDLSPEPEPESSSGLTELFRATPIVDESETHAAALEDSMPYWLTDLSGSEDIATTPSDQVALTEPMEEETTTDDEPGVIDWLTDLTAEEEPEGESGAPDWLSQMPQDAAALPSAPIDEGEGETPDWISSFAVEEEAEPDAALPDWLSQMPQDAAALPSTPIDEGEGETPDWMSRFAVEEEAEPDTALPDWLSQMPQDTAATPQPSDDEAELPDWLETLDFTEDTTLTLETDSDLTDSDRSSLLEQFDLENLEDIDQARETTNMADVPSKPPRRNKEDEPKNELDWLDELAGLPLDEPSTVPGSQNELDVPAAGQLDDDQAELDAGDAAWLDALNPASANADLPLDWLDQLDQPEVEESPTLSWLSEDDLRGQATNAYANASAEPGEDLEEAMAWLESIVTDQESPQPTYDADTPETGDELNWLDSLVEEPAAAESDNIVLTEESPTTVEQIPAPDTAEDEFLGDLFDMSDQPEAAAELSAAISWLDELESAGQPSTLSGDFVHAGPPPDDPEAAMAWLEQLAAAQAAEEAEEPSAEWAEEAPGWPSELPATESATPEGLDWLDSLTEPAGEEETADLFSLEQPLDQSATWLDEISPLVSEEPAESLPNWLDELAETPTDEPLPGPSLILEETETAGTLNWLDELPEPATDEPLPGPSLTTEEAEPSFDWLDDLAAASPGEGFPLDEPTGENLPDWLDELPSTPEVPDTTAATVLEQPASPPPAEPTYVPPTNISPEAAKILDMSDLFEMGAVEESEEDMAQAMAWMSELMGDLGTPAAAPIAPEPSAAEELPWLDELITSPADEAKAETPITVVTIAPEPEPEPEPVRIITPPADQPTYVPPTNISPEAAKILDMSDLFEMDAVEESEEDMAQAMAWMNELIGDLGQPTTPTTPPPAEITPEPVAERPLVVEVPAEEMAEPMDWLDELVATPAAPAAAVAPETDEAMAWLDEIVADIEHEPVAAALPSEGTGDEAMDWLNEIVADLGMEEPPTPPAAMPVPEPEPPVSQPVQAAPPAEPAYVPPTHISPEAAKILDMSDLFEMGTVEESEEDMAQAMAWMQELMGDMGTTTPTAPTTPSVAETTPEPEPEIPITVVAAAPPADVVEEADSALDWLNELADLEAPIAEMPDLDQPFSVHDLDRSTPTAEDASAALSWLDQMVAEQGGQPEAVSPATTGSEDLFADLSSIPEDPDAAMDWLENLAAAQESSEAPVATPSPVIEEPPTPAVPTAVMDALAKVETRREKAKTGPLRPPVTPPPPPPAEEETPLSLISELTAGDVSESLPEWLSLDKINVETSTLSWLSSRDMDATGWLESEAAMVDAEPEMNLPLVTPIEPVRDDMPRREPEPLTFPQVSEPFEFKVDLDMGGDDGQFVMARQHLQERHYDEAVRSYSTLLESTPSVSPLITELEGAVDSHPSQPLLRRLLGDAYMRNGQLQKALETYRKALDQL